MTNQTARLLPAAGLCLLVLVATAAAVPAKNRAGAAWVTLLVHEIEYDPHGDDSACEWIELYNPMTTAIDLAGWRLRDNTTFDPLPGVIVPPGGAIVVAATASFYDNYPTFTGTLVVLGSYIGNGLSNTGDRVILQDPGGATVDALSYGADTSVFDCAGYPCSGVPEGASLERSPAGCDTGTAADFVARQVPTPGRILLPAPASSVLLDAVYYDGYAAYDDDEAVRLVNVGASAVDLGGWSLGEAASRAGAFFPGGSSLDPGEAIWCARQATAFEAQFGFKPDFETEDTDPVVPELAGAWPELANDGGTCVLRDLDGQIVDVVVYKDGDTDTPGWSGPAVFPWTSGSLFGTEGQILFRKRDETTGLPSAEPISPSVTAWAQDPGDALAGRRVLYPGWDVESFFYTARVTETANLTIAVAPDHLLDAVVAQLGAAQTSILIEAYTIESLPLMQVLLDRLAAGVQVRMLLEGSPAGGIESAQRWICDQLRRAGAGIWFMYAGADPARYRYQHAKAIVIDDRIVLVGTENLNPSAMPADDKSNGTAGRRGVYLITDAAGVVERVRAVIEADLDPAHHADLVTCTGVPELCTGTPPPPEPDWMTYTVAFSAPLVVHGEMAFEVVQSPETSLRTHDSLLGLIAQAGAGDTVLVEQFYEYDAWGPPGATPENDPNPRLQALLAAARRGARVRILLNEYAFDDEMNDNTATLAYLRSAATGFDLEVRLGNPAALGLHNKMVLVRLDGQGTVHVGSINGSEVSSKANRELALQVQSDEAYEYLAGVFAHDWAAAPVRAYLPVACKICSLPAPATHPLISEVFYAVSKEREWVEILNPTSAAIDLSGFMIGDAQRSDSYEGMYVLPAGTLLAPQQLLVIASSAAAFRTVYGAAPDFEFYETDSAVPTLTPSPVWGEGEWELRADGDEVLLLDPGGGWADVVVYGDASLPGVVPHPGVAFFSHSLERFPARFDTDDCAADFRDQPFPGPGALPQ